MRRLDSGFSFSGTWRRTRSETEKDRLRGIHGDSGNLYSMKPHSVEREVLASGVMAQATFGIRIEDQVHLIRILRDTLYPSKVRAVLREYSSNAWDANRSL